MKYLFLLTAILVFISCEKNSTEPENQPDSNLLEFEGNYKISSLITDGMHEIFDSLGNVVDYEYRTSTEEDNLSISFKNGDTLLVDGFYFSLGSFIQEAPVKLNDNNEFEILFNYSDPFKKDEIIGTIWFEADSIHLEYDWDKTWSTAPVPNKGSVRSRGIKF